MEELGNKVLDIINNRNYIKKYVILSIVLLFSAINYNLFVLPLGLVTGGTSGVATITKYLFNLDPALVIFLQSFIILMLSYLFLGKEDTMAAFFISIIHPFFIKLTEGIGRYILIDKTSTLLLVIITGLISGVTTGIIYKTGLNTGGFGVVSKIIGRRHKIATAKVSFVINMIIVILGGFVFGIDMILYAGIVLYLTKYISEKVLLGNSRNKLFYIISDNYEEITKYILEELNHDYTVFNVKGKYSDVKKKNIMTVIPTFEYVKVKERIKELDKNAFVIITDNYEVKGQDIKISSVKSSKKDIVSRIFSDEVV